MLGSHGANATTTPAERRYRTPLSLQSQSFARQALVRPSFSPPGYWLLAAGRFRLMCIPGGELGPSCGISLFSAIQTDPAWYITVSQGVLWRSGGRNRQAHWRSRLCTWRRPERGRYATSEQKSIPTARVPGKKGLRSAACPCGYLLSAASSARFRASRPLHEYSGCASGQERACTCPETGFLGILDQPSRWCRLLRIYNLWLVFQVGVDHVGKHLSSNVVQRLGGLT